MASLKKLAIEATGTMEVKDAAGEVVKNDDGSVWSITTYSPGTKEFQKAKHAFDEKRSNGLTALIGGKDQKRSPEDDTRDVAEFLAAVTVSFNGFDYEGKKGYEAYKAAYMDLEIGHVAEDLNKFLGKRGNFVKKPAPTSNDTSGSLPG